MEEQRRNRGKERGRERGREGGMDEGREGRNRREMKNKGVERTIREKTKWKMRRKN